MATAVREVPQERVGQEDQQQVNLLAGVQETLANMGESGVVQFLGWILGLIWSLIIWILRAAVYLVIGGSDEATGYGLLDRARLVFLLSVFVTMWVIPTVYDRLGGIFISFPTWLFIGSHFYFLVWLIMWYHDGTRNIFEFYIGVAGLAAPLIAIFARSATYDKLDADFFLIQWIDPWWVWGSAALLFVNIRIFQPHRNGTYIEDYVEEKKEPEGENKE